MLRIKNLEVISDECVFLDRVSLEVKPGEIHAVMGPEFSGKSALANIIAGAPFLSIKEGSMTWNRKRLSTINPEHRFNSGIFLCHQMPPEFNEFSNYDICKEVYGGEFSSQEEFSNQYQSYANLIKLGNEPAFKNMNNYTESLNYSKKNELIYMFFADPDFVILDEIDQFLSPEDIENIGGLMYDYLRDNRSSVIISNNKDFLDKVKPTHVHVIVEGRLRISGGPDLYERIIDDEHSELS